MKPIYPECECGNSMEFMGTKPHQVWFVCITCGLAKVYREVRPAEDAG